MGFTSPGYAQPLFPFTNVRWGDSSLILDKSLGWDKLHLASRKATSVWHLAPATHGPAKQHCRITKGLLADAAPWQPLPNTGLTVCSGPASALALPLLQEGCLERQVMSFDKVLLTSPRHLSATSCEPAAELPHYRAAPSCPQSANNPSQISGALNRNSGASAYRLQMPGPASLSCVMSC